MSRLMLMSDLHLGHKNICKYRTQFSSEDEHHNTIFENLATNINKRDTLYLLGDVAFTPYWLNKIASIKCYHKVLICGNHDTERGIKMEDLVDVYDNVYSLISKRNYWLSHCPIHPQEIRGKLGNIHGHTHNRKIMNGAGEESSKYINACVEHTDYKPIEFNELVGEI